MLPLKKKSRSPRLWIYFLVHLPDRLYEGRVGVPVKFLTDSEIEHISTQRPQIVVSVKTDDRVFLKMVLPDTDKVLVIEGKQGLLEDSGELMFQSLKRVTGGSDDPLEKKPISRQRKSAKPTNSISSPHPTANRHDDQLKLALTFPDPEGPRFGSAFLDIARTAELPVGARGALMLSELKQLELGIDLFRRRYRQQLREQPDSVPGWGLQHTSLREIPDTAAAFRLLADRPLWQNAFLEACKVSLAALEKAFGAVQALPPEEARTFVDRILNDVMATREVTRLVQLKGFKAWQQTERLEGEESEKARDAL
jgi:hypothetical protein